MAIIRLETYIRASRENCFDLSRSVELHKFSMKESNESVIGGRSEGLFEEGDRVKWRAKHFGIFLTMEMEISGIRYPESFEDRMITGPFKSIIHLHHFQSVEGGTRMYDDFQYEVPFGIPGRLFDVFVLKAYMTRLLKKRNQVIKQKAEGAI